MLKIINEFFKLLTPSQRKRFYWLQILVVIMAFTEIIGIASIAPFMALIGDISLLEADNLLADIYLKSGLDDPYEFVLYLGFTVLIILTISTIVTMYISWLLAMFATKVGAEIADRLYSYYLGEDWLFHTMTSSSELTKKIANESSRVTGQVLLPLMLMNSRIILAFSIAVTLFLFNPIVAIVAVTIFSIAYIILFKIVRNQLEINGMNISRMFAKRFKLMNEGFGGIKDVLLLGRSDSFNRRFLKTGIKLAYSQGTNTAMAAVPRYLLELVSYGSMIALVLYLVKNYQGDLGYILPILSIYALAGMKLLPALQQIYASIATLQGNLSAYYSIREDLIEINSKNLTKLKPDSLNKALKNDIKLENITFNYPNKIDNVIDDISLQIKENSIVGFIGSSGSGKSTLVDIITGLITPQEGIISIGGKVLDQTNIRSWQNKIGFVSQSIFLSEGTIAENIAFGLEEDLIDYSKVKNALKLSSLEDFVEGLEFGVNSKVGERGVQLSGGQRQRIGIARALYDEAEVLVFDEATSALDGITEKIIMDAINDFNGKKTIIMIAHRLQTVKNCDQIFMFEKGKIIDCGTYKGLLDSNEQFRKMSNLS
ncbi:ABC transporter ATP-binding protein/permease [Gammaproteobacteria bacterium]|nr:ABC transporter ATP-binding protein/permease [Gammaproteobacteria bacterium]